VVVVHSILDHFSFLLIEESRTGGLYQSLYDNAVRAAFHFCNKPSYRYRCSKAKAAARRNSPCQLLSDCTIVRFRNDICVRLDIMTRNTDKFSWQLSNVLYIIIIRVHCSCLKFVMMRRVRALFDSNYNFLPRTYLPAEKLGIIRHQSLPRKKRIPTTAHVMKCNCQYSHTDSPFFIKGTNK
jgi:hypothetical protein